MPTICTDLLVVEDEVRDSDAIEKYRGKEAADIKRKAKESEIEAGDVVIMRGKGSDKLSARFNVLEPCLVTGKEGATITVKTGEDRVYTRNVTAVKKAIVDSGPEVGDEKNAKTGEVKDGATIVMGKQLRNRDQIRAPQKLSLNIESV